MSRQQLPDFLIGGAPRAGTSWLSRVLDHHPDIYMAKPERPEPKFFLIDDLYEQGLAYYASWFADAPNGSMKGEKSTNYLESAVAADRISRALPGVKLIFSLREPAERAYSNYLWSKANGLENEDFPTAVQLESLRDKSCPPEYAFSRPHAYLSRGMYADLLKPYFDRFPREQILCVRFEDLTASPRQTVARIHRFLSRRELPETAASVAPLNATQSEGDTVPDHVAAIRRHFTEANDRLRDLLGPDFKVWE